MGYLSWSRDGKFILFSSDRTGEFSLYRKAASGADQEELLDEREGVSVPTDASAKNLVLFTNTSAETGNDIWGLSVAGDRKAEPVLRSKSSESRARLSPDGRWLAYESDETGSPKVYVVSFPDAKGKWQVSTEDATRPVWSRDGKELFYLSAGGKMVAVAVHSGVGFEHGAPKPLFGVRMSPTSPFDINTDGRRFLILNGVEPDVTAPITLVVNWNVGLKK